MTNEVIWNRGSNTYKLPHVQKDKLVRMLQCDIPLSLPCQAKIDGGALSGQVIVESMQCEQEPTPNAMIENFSHFNGDMIDWGSNGTFDFDDMHAAIDGMEHGDVMDIDGGDEGGDVEVGEVEVDEDGVEELGMRRDGDGVSRNVAQSMLDFASESAIFGEFV